eukprot:10376895-Prorocentrum_lima.AAC.1
MRFRNISGDPKHAFRERGAGRNCPVPCREDTLLSVGPWVTFYVVSSRTKRDIFDDMSSYEEW